MRLFVQPVCGFWLQASPVARLGFYYQVNFILDIIFSFLIFGVNNISQALSLPLIRLIRSSTFLNTEYGYIDL